MNGRPVAVITGASRGIGRGIAAELARTHTVVGTYKSRKAEAESLVRECGVDIFQCDVASEDDRGALLEYVKSRYGRIDLLVNNAGIAPRQRRDILESTPESFEELMAVNLKGPHFLTQQAALWMVQQGGGRIIFITSISANTVSLNRAEYCLSKAALSMSAAIFARRLAPSNIQVFEIRPGIIRTDMIATVRETYEERIRSGLIPQGRMGEAADVARAVRAIADGLLDYSTGAIIEVDGGFHVPSL
jgi:3-oxoacyl-[acyl-carrier protein] reductase